uniref:NADH dehydrogenase subunit 5b n=1 Tax=Colponema vietnamica TaxID=1492817 RepID=V5KWF5_9ALVE|nr:NADH dehydrogenase subunit 5b [Colponema vietnamica]ATY40862.1 NADH dehydrogenase subunit 5b [Colponema vietnamica]
MLFLTNIRLFLYKVYLKKWNYDFLLNIFISINFLNLIYTDLFKKFEFGILEIFGVVGIYYIIEQGYYKVINTFEQFSLNFKIALFLYGIIFFILNIYIFI